MTSSDQSPRLLRIHKPQCRQPAPHQAVEHMALRRGLSGSREHRPRDQNWEWHRRRTRQPSPGIRASRQRCRCTSSRWVGSKPPLRRNPGRPVWPGSRPPADRARSGTPLRGCVRGKGSSGRRASARWTWANPASLPSYPQTAGGHSSARNPRTPPTGRLARLAPPPLMTICPPIGPSRSWSLSLPNPPSRSQTRKC